MVYIWFYRPYFLSCHNFYSRSKFHPKYCVNLLLLVISNKKKKNNQIILINYTAQYLIWHSFWNWLLFINHQISNIMGCKNICAFKSRLWVFFCVVVFCCCFILGVVVVFWGVFGGLYLSKSYDLFITPERKHNRRNINHICSVRNIKTLVSLVIWLVLINQWLYP